MIQKVGQIGITVKNIENAIHFYKEKLGLSLLFQTENMAFFDCSDLRLLISLPENKEFDHPSSTIYFQVENIEAAFEELIRNEVVVASEPHLVAKMKTTETWKEIYML